MKVAQFKSVIGGYTAVYDERLAKHVTGVVQISEFVDIEFPPLATEEVVQQQLSALDSAETELRAKFDQKLSEINTQRAELRALTHQVQS
jgi:hypothetical protein